MLVAIVGALALAGCGSTVQVQSTAPVGDGLGPAGTGQQAQTASDTAAAGAAASGTATSSTGSASLTSAGNAISSATGGLAGTDGTSQGANTAGTSHPQQDFARGVTATTITLGILYPVDFDTAASTFGLGNATTGNTQAQTQAIINSINANGGVAGRKLVPVWVPFHTVGNGQDPDPGYCAQLTQDQKVFAVMSTVGMDDELTACLGKAHMPLIDDAAGRSAATLEGLTLLQPGAPLQERTYRGEIPAMMQRGFLTPSSKIGLLWDGTASLNQLATGTVEPELRAAGLHIVSTFAASNDASQVSSYGNAVLKFQSAGVDMVIPIGTSPLFFMQDANSQLYYPNYILNSDYGPGALLQTAAPQKELANAVGIGWAPYADVDTAHNPGPVNAAETRCLTIMDRAGQASSSALTRTEEVQMCDAFFVLQAALKNTTEVTPSNLVSGTLALGKTYLSSATFRTQFTDRLDGPSAVRQFSYFSSCSCFQYDRPLAPMA